jgi:hypothetical protein
MAEKKGKEGSSGIQWWRDLPGWVQAVVAVLTLIGVGGAGGAVIHAAGSNSHNQPTHNPSTSEAPRLVPGQPIWSGPIAIASGGGGIDLDYNPPTHGSNNLTFDPFNGFRSDTGNYKMAQWNGSSPPSRDQCTHFVNTHSYTSLPVQSGSSYCLLTAGGHTAYLQVASIDTTLDNGTVYVRTMIWNTTGHSTAQPAPNASQARQLYARSIAFSANSGGIDLGSNPPTHGSNNLTFDPFNGFRSDTGNYTIAPWNGGTPIYSMCHTWAETHVIASAPAHVGAAYCLLTGEGNTAYLKVTGINSTLDNGTVMVNLVVWNS